VVVRSLHSDWSHFGSWVIEGSEGEGEDRRDEAITTILQGGQDSPGPDVIRVVWDGKEQQLAVSRHRTTAISINYAAVSERVRKFQSSAEALTYAESLLLNHLAAPPRPDSSGVH